MNKYKLLFVLVIFLLFPVVSFASSKDVTVQYKESSNVVSFVSDIDDNKASFIIGNYNITVNCKEDIVGSKIILIKLSGESYDWLSNINGDGEYYYLGVLNNNEIIESSSIKNILVDDSLIKVYNNNGSLISSDTDMVELKKSDVFLSFNDINEEKNKISLDIIGNGKVIIDDNVYSSSQDISVDDKVNKIIIMSDSNYTFSEAYLNEKSIFTLFSNNVYDYKFVNGDTLKINFTINDDNAISNDGITLSGYLRINGVAVQNAKIILHSNEIIAYTDNYGYYELKNVSFGEHEMLILSENETPLGYSKFLINKSSDGKVSSKVVSGDQIINVNSNSEYSIDLNLLSNMSINFDNISEIIDNNSKSGFNYLYLLFIIPVILLIILIMRNKKSK